jgi:TPR repeat protein
MQLRGEKSRGASEWGSQMVREFADASDVSAPAGSSAEALYELGLACASGRSAPADLVSAHKWFNLAAMKGHSEAAHMRREIAAEMMDAEIGQAQRAARAWLKDNAEATPARELRVAA